MPYAAFTTEGSFRGTIADYTLSQPKEGPSKSIGVNILVVGTGWWDAENEQWNDCEESDWRAEAYGYVNIVKKDGSLNEKSIENLVKNAGWDGDITSIVQKTWEPTPIAFTIKADEYDGKTTYKVNYINPFDYTPGGGGFKAFDPQAGKSLANQYGSQLRALASKFKPKALPTNGTKPSAPPKPKPKSEPAPKQETVPPSDDDGGDVPF